MSVKLTVLWKGNGSAGASPQALADLVSSNLVQGVIQQSGRAAAVTLKRDDLEKLLASRSSGARSALQAVKDAYAEIGLMREEGVSWGEIAELLGQNGAVGRDGKPFGAATVRAAFFLVGAEVRQGQTEGDDAGADSFADVPMLGDAPTVEDAMAALVSPEPEQAESGYEPAELPPFPPLESAQPSETPPVAAAVEPVSEPEAPALPGLEDEAPSEPVAVFLPEIPPEPEPLPEVVADPVIEAEGAIEVAPVADEKPAPEPVAETPEAAEEFVATAPESEVEAPVVAEAAPVEAKPIEIEPIREAPQAEPLAELIPEDEAAAEVEAEAEFEPDSVPVPVAPGPPAYHPTPAPRPADNWLLRRADEPVPDILAKDEPVPAVVGPTPAVAAPLPAFEPEPLSVPRSAPRPVVPAPAPEKARGTSPFTHETAMTYDWWTRRIDSST